MLTRNLIELSQRRIHKDALCEERGKVKDKIGFPDDRNFPCQSLKIRKVSRVVMGS
jgi:hypothetical protein